MSPISPSPLISDPDEVMLVRHERPAVALRSAQIALWRAKGWDAPYYWAAFTLQGEWK